MKAGETLDELDALAALLHLSGASPSRPAARSSGRWRARAVGPLHSSSFGPLRCCSTRSAGGNAHAGSASAAAPGPLEQCIGIGGSWYCVTGYRAAIS